MKSGFTATITIELKTDKNNVWDALTNKERIRQYFFGTEAISEWKAGSPIVFKGEWEGKAYEDKGIIKEIIPGKLLHYTYWSSFSGTEDKPENYANIWYKLSSKNGFTNLEIIQDGLASEEMKAHSESNWQMVLKGLKELIEKGQ